MMGGPSVWGHTLVAEEIIMPKLVDKGKGKRRRKTRGKRRAGRRKREKRQHKTENKPQPIIRHRDEAAYKQDIKCQVHSKASVNLVDYEDSYIITGE